MDVAEGGRARVRTITTEAVASTVVEGDGVIDSDEDDDNTLLVVPEALGGPYEAPAELLATPPSSARRQTRKRASRSSSSKAVASSSAAVDVVADANVQMSGWSSTLATQEQDVNGGQGRTEKRSRAKGEGKGGPSVRKRRKEPGAGGDVEEAPGADEDNVKKVRENGGDNQGPEEVPPPAFPLPPLPSPPLQLAQLSQPVTRAVVLARPSRFVKSPYLADVRLEDGTETIVHAPSLGVGGQVAENTTVFVAPWGTKAKIIKDKWAGARKAREKKAAAAALVAKGLEESDADDGDQAADQEEEGEAEPAMTTRKSTHVLYHVMHPAGLVVGLHPLTANLIAAPLVESGQLLLQGAPPIEKVEKEKTWGCCRFDFILHHTDGTKTVVEVKNVSHGYNKWDGSKLPRKRKKPKKKPKKAKDKEDEGEAEEQPPEEPEEVDDGNSASYDKIALFPVGTKKKAGHNVISPRALKHIEDLERLVKEGQARAVMLFVVQRCDCTRFCVSKGDPVYRAAVLKAAHAGVLLRAISVRWSEDGQSCSLHRWLPFI